MIVKKFKTVYVESYRMNKVFSGWCTSSCQGSTRISKARNQKAKERNVTYIKHFVPNGKTSAEYSLITSRTFLAEINDLLRKTVLLSFCILQILKILTVNFLALEKDFEAKGIIQFSRSF